MLNRQNLLIARLAGTYLPGVLVNPTETVVTDGKQMIVVSVPPPNGDIPEIPGLEASGVFRPFVIPKEKALEVAAAATDVCDHVLIDARDGRIVLGVTDLETPQAFPIEELKVNPIDYQRVMRPEREAQADLSVDAALLLPVVRHLRAFLEAGRRIRSTAAAKITIRIFPKLDQQPAILSLEATSDESQTMTAWIAPLAQ